MPNREFWLMCESSDTIDAFNDIGNPVLNFKVIDDALDELRYVRSLKIKGDPLIPEQFPQPILSLPLGFAVDYFGFGSMIFVSRKFRDALAQPPNVIQYWPVKIKQASEMASMQDYQLLRILASQDAMNWERSVYDKEEITNRRTGEKMIYVRFIDRFVPLPGLVPRTEIFRSAEDYLSILVTDALAERVMRAGCDGVVFREPETIGILGRDNEPRLIRTAYGIIPEDAADLSEAVGSVLGGGSAAKAYPSVN